MALKPGTRNSAGGQVSTSTAAPRKQGEPASVRAAYDKQQPAAPATASSGKGT
jgi:hypothetical protein